MNKIIKELAIFIYKEYEWAARQQGRITQKDCHVHFDDLPEANKETMLYVAQRIYYKYIKGKQKQF